MCFCTRTCSYTPSVQVLEEMKSADPSTESGRRARDACTREMAKASPFDRGTYPRDCEQKLSPQAKADADMVECVHRMEHSMSQGAAPSKCDA